jgi:hypothetical protein
MFVRALAAHLSEKERNAVHAQVVGGLVNKLLRDGRLSRTKKSA